MPTLIRLLVFNFLGGAAIAAGFVLVETIADKLKTEKK